MARRQQAARAAARLDREQARLAREVEKTEKQEAARRDREARSQQLLEVTTLTFVICSLQWKLYNNTHDELKYRTLKIVCVFI